MYYGDVFCWFIMCKYILLKILPSKILTTKVELQYQTNCSCYTFTSITDNKHAHDTLNVHSKFHFYTYSITESKYTFWYFVLLLSDKLKTFFRSTICVDYSNHLIGIHIVIGFILRLNVSTQIMFIVDEFYTNLLKKGPQITIRYNC